MFTIFVDLHFISGYNVHEHRSQIQGAHEMFKQIITLFRGAAHTASEDFTDRHALLILQQQMRDSAHALAAARKAVAVAMAQNKQEQAQYERLVERLKDLEDRAVAALEQEKHDLAREAAETIAMLEAERDASSQALAQFTTEITRLRTNVRNEPVSLRHGQGKGFADQVYMLSSQ